jgi:small-conductance mechanosensitive channel
MPNEDKSAPRSLQQQPRRDSDPQQQRSGATDFQSRPEGQDQVEGEGSYSATREYQKNIKEYLEKADVESDAEAAKPRSESEARELEEAERAARSHSKGER